MKLVLKKGQVLGDILPIVTLKAFPTEKPVVPNKRLNARKFVGVIKTIDDPLNIQRKMRNEWNEDPD